MNGDQFMAYLRVCILGPIPEDATLGDVDDMFRDGSITEQEAQTYINAWNATPCRFTEAYLAAGTIRQREKP